MEAEGINADQPLRQGDIIAAHPEADNWADPWKRFGVVLTADCDIAQRKAGPNLVTIPIVSYSVFLADEWLPSQAAELASIGKTQIEKALARFDAGIKFRQLASWTARDPEKSIEEHIIEALPTKTDSIDKKTITRISELSEAVKGAERLTAVSNTPRVNELRSSLLQLVKSGLVIASTQFSGEEPGMRLIEEALSSLATRLDTWLIRELQGLDPGMEDGPTFGYVVPLRSLNFLPINLIETDRGRWHREKRSYLRICRLKAPYKTDLVYHFANLFTRVGLEDQRLEEHRRMFSLCAKDLFRMERENG